LKLRGEITDWWRRTRAGRSAPATLGVFLSLTSQFLRESTPEQRRRRYGDMEFDWEHRVDTTAATVSARDRFIGLLNSPYQATEPALFREMMAALPIRFEDFTFIDLGSGKGRTLLMAASYPFRRITGVELLPALHKVCCENIAEHSSSRIEALCGDAKLFEFPEEPTVLYLFNPLPRSILEKVLSNVKRSVLASPRPLWIVYHNPLEEDAVMLAGGFRKSSGTHQYSVFERE